jgi:hypothetical protein
VLPGQEPAIRVAEPQPHGRCRRRGRAPRPGCSLTPP